MKYTTFRNSLLAVGVLAASGGIFFAARPSKPTPSVAVAATKVAPTPAGSADKPAATDSRGATPATGTADPLAARGAVATPAAKAPEESGAATRGAKIPLREMDREILKLYAQTKAQGSKAVKTKDAFPGRPYKVNLYVEGDQIRIKVDLNRNGKWDEKWSFEPGSDPPVVKRQVSRANPLLPVDLLRRPIFALSVAASTCSFAAQSMAFVTLPFYLERGLGFGRGETGLLMTPWPVTVMLVAPAAGRLADRFSPGLLGGLGQALMVVGLLLLAFLPAHPALWDIGWRMSLCGVGFGLFNSPNNKTMIGSAPPSRAGGASGMQATSRLLGQTSGVALVALVFGLVATGGTTVALCIAAAFSVLACLASVLRTGRGVAL